MTREEFLRSVDAVLQMEGALTWETPLREIPRFDSLTVTTIVSLADIEFDVLLRAVAVREADSMNEILQMLLDAGARI